MRNKSLIGLIAILVVLVSISGCVNNTETNNAGNQIQQNTNQSASGLVSSEEAKKIAKKYIEEPNATAGEPTLINTDGKQTYIVPIMLKGNQAGEILIDAKTGENIAGAGGIPNDDK